MSTEKTPDVDLEKQDNEKTIRFEDNDESFEKLKEKTPPGINASLVMLYALFSFMFVIGWVNLNNCPTSRLIPIYLIVTGFVGALAKFVSKTTNTHLFNVTVLLVVFYLIWHCLGTYWVYKEYEPSYAEKPGNNYCNRTTYLLAFWILTLQHTLLGLSILLIGCQWLMKGDFKKK